MGGDFISIAVYAILNDWKEGGIKAWLGAY